MESPLSVRLRSLVQISQRRLAALLVSPTRSDLHIHHSLIKPFERVCGASWLRQHGIDKIFKMDPKMAAPANINRVYLIPSCLITLKHVLDQINSVLGQNSNDENYSITIIVVPKLLSVYESLLEEEGLSGIVALKSFQWELMYLDGGILSLELPCLFKTVFVNKDSTLLSCISSTLWTLFQAVGKPKLFISLGKHSSSILEMYDIFCDSFDKGDSTKNENEFGALLLIDRDQDYTSTLLTPATYSGLLFEIFNIKCGDLDLDVDNTKFKKGQLNLESPPQQEETKTKKPIKMALDSDADSIYSEIRYLHFSGVFPILSAKAKDLNIEGTKITNIQLDQMKQAISTKLQQVIAIKRSLSNHILACETIVSTLGDKFEDIQIAERSLIYNKNKKSNVTYLEENICTDVNMYMSLKMLCLLTLTQGITYEEYNNILTKYLHAFGYKYLYVFQNLINAGLIVAPTNTKFQLGIPNISSISEKLPKWQNNFQVTANKLKQLPSDAEGVVVKEPTCPSFVFSGTYIPLVAAIAKIILSTDNVNDFLTRLTLINDIKIGGSVIDGLKNGVGELCEKLSNMNSNSSADIDLACKDLKSVSNYLRSEELKNPFLPLKPRSLLIFIVGGITQAEIAACHLVEKLTGGKIVFASDLIISSENIIQAAM